MRFLPVLDNKPSAKIIDYEPAARDNRDSDWGSFEGRPSTKTTLETAPKPFQRSLTTYVTIPEYFKRSSLDTRTESEIPRQLYDARRPGGEGGTSTNW